MNKTAFIKFKLNFFFFLYLLMRFFFYSFDLNYISIVVLVCTILFFSVR